MAANPQTAVTVVKPAAIDSWEPRTLEILADYPRERFNVLVPTVSLRQVNPYLVPDIEAVQLDPNPDAGHIYHDPQMKAGHYGPTKVGLRLLAQVAGITTISSRRVDDGRDPDYIEWQVEIEMVQPSGRPIRGFGSKQVDLRPAMVKGWTPERIARAHEHMVANAESKALNRAIRSILSLRPSYPQRELAKPFAILRYVPDMSHPEVRARFLDMVAPTTVALYGSEPTSAPKQVGPGAPDGIDRASVVTDDDEADDDDPAAGPRDVTPAAATTSDAGDEPAWMRGAPATAETQAPGAPPDLATRIRDTAAAGGMRGPAKDPQIVTLREIFGVVGGRATTGGLQVIWGADFNVDELTANQAQAIIGIARQYDTDQAFATEWRAMAGVEQAT